MGLFDMFGAGGGKLELQPNNVSLSPGQVLDGRVVFNSGSRAQQITNVKVKLTSTQYHMENTPQGPQQRSKSANVAPEIQVSGAVTTQPSQRYEFPFSIQLPTQMMSSAPNVCTYHLSASADIDNEVDPGAGTAISIVGGMMAQQPMVGGMPGQPMMGGMPDQPMMGGMPGQPMMAAAAGAMVGGMMQPGMMQPGMMQPGMMQPGMMQPGMQPGMMQPAMMQPGPIAIGSQVLAQWQDGQFHPAVVVQIQNGYYAIDWTNPQLGATSWVGPQQVQHAPMGQPGMMQQPMMGQPMMQQPVMQQMPQMQQPMGGGLQPGAAVWAQSSDGNWNPAKLVSSQNGFHAVDWENAKLGPTAWVSAAQIKPR